MGFNLTSKVMICNWIKLFSDLAFIPDLLVCISNIQSGGACWLPVYTSYILSRYQHCTLKSKITRALILWLDIPTTGGGVHCIHTLNNVHHGLYIFKPVRVTFWFPGGVIPITQAFISLWSTWSYTSSMIFTVHFCLSLSLLSFCRMIFYSVGSSPTFTHADHFITIKISAIYSGGQIVIFTSFFPDVHVSI